MSNPTLAERILAMTVEEKRAMFEEWASKQHPPYYLKLNSYRFSDTSHWYDSERTEHTYQGFVGALLAQAAALVEQEPVVTPEMIANTRKIAEDTLAISEAMDKLRAKYGLAAQEGQEPVGYVKVGALELLKKYLDERMPKSMRIYNDRYSDREITVPLYAHAHRAAQEGDAKWVSVNDERKPEPGQVILVYAFSLTHGEDDEGNYRANETEEVAMGEYRRTTANGTDYHFDCFTFPNGDVDSISHWMPLPDAPASTTTPKG